MDSGSGPWVLRALDTLAGCAARVVVVGAAADRVVELLPPDVLVARNPSYADGMGSSLRVGLQALGALSTVDAAVVMLVDLPGVGSTVVDRVCGAAGPPLLARKALTRATFQGRPGHPVLIGRDHFAGVIDTATGDRGARDYLSTHPVMGVECGDIGTGEDVDIPE